MKYCTKDQWVIISSTGQIGMVVRIINRRLHNKDGRVIVQCGADGPLVEANMEDLAEASHKDYEITMGIRHHDE